MANHVHREDVVGDDARAIATRWRSAMARGDFAPATVLVMSAADWPGRLLVIHESDLDSLLVGRDGDSDAAELATAGA